MEESVQNTTNEMINEESKRETFQNKKDLAFFVDSYLEELRVKKQRKSMLKSKITGGKDKEDPPPNLMTGDFKPAL